MTKKFYSLERNKEDFTNLIDEYVALLDTQQRIGLSIEEEARFQQLNNHFGQTERTKQSEFQKMLSKELPNS